MNSNNTFQQANDYYLNTHIPNEEKLNSYFDGTATQLIGWNILFCVIAVCTFGLGLPWIKCLKIRWETKHTIINGKRLYFNGTAPQLFGKLIVWHIVMFVIFMIPVIIALNNSDSHSSHYYYDYQYHSRSSDVFSDFLFAIFIDVILGVFITAEYSVYLKKWVIQHTVFIQDIGIVYEHDANGNIYYPLHKNTYYQQQNVYPPTQHFNNSVPINPPTQYPNHSVPKNYTNPQTQDTNQSNYPQSPN